MGEIRVHKLYALSESDAGWALRNTSDKGFIIAGWGSISNNDCLELIKTDPNGDVYPIGIKKNNGLIPKDFVLHQNYPNPFNPTTIIKFDTPPQPSPKEREPVSVTLVVYDDLGREGTTPVNQQMKPGSYEVKFDGSNYASGLYFYRLESGSFVEVKKMVLIK